MKPIAKVCGLVSPGDAAHAAAEGADLLGFVFHSPSVRHCADLSAASACLDRAVLVMVTDQLEFLLETAQRFGFRWVQPYLPAALRGAAVASLRAAGLQVLLPWADEPDQEQVPADLYLWEPSAAVTGLPGGSGQGHGMLHPPPGPFLLAGGLDAANLKTKVGQVPAAARPRFRGVDAASRLEAGPDRKDPQKVTDFICRAHELELV